MPPPRSTRTLLGAHHADVSRRGIICARCPSHHDAPLVQEDDEDHVCSGSGWKGDTGRHTNTHSTQVTANEADTNYGEPHPGMIRQPGPNTIVRGDSAVRHQPPQWKQSTHRHTHRHLPSRKQLRRCMVGMRMTNANRSSMKVFRACGQRGGNSVGRRG
jgi:hypothetical protein